MTTPQYDKRACDRCGVEFPVEEYGSTASAKKVFCRQCAYQVVAGERSRVSAAVKKRKEKPPDDSSPAEKRTCRICGETLNDAGSKRVCKRCNKEIYNIVDEIRKLNQTFDPILEDPSLPDYWRAVELKSWAEAELLPQLKEKIKSKFAVLLFLRYYQKQFGDKLNRECAVCHKWKPARSFAVVRGGLRSRVCKACEIVYENST